MTSARPGRARISVLKVLYLFAVTVAAFAIPNVELTRRARWWTVPSLLLVQAAILLRCGISLRDVFRSAARLKWLFTILLVCYAFLPGEDRRSVENWQQVTLPFTGRSLGVNLGGLSLAALMCVQILTVIMASAVVRLTGPGTDLVDGLRALGLPTLFVHALDQTLGQLGGLRRRHRENGGGHGEGAEGRRQTKEPAETRALSPGFFAILRQMLKGNVGFFTQAIQGNLQRAKEQVERDAGGQLDQRTSHDVAVITGVALVMVSLKMLKALPGVPFASGHKTLLFFPLYILAARLTNTRWGGTAAGSVMGLMGFLQGDGRFGILDVLKHLSPGLLIDLLMPIVKRLPQSAWVYCGLGFLAAIARTTTEFAVVLLLGARAEVYLFAVSRTVPNLIAGTLSGFVTVYVLRAFPTNIQRSAALAPANSSSTSASYAEPSKLLSDSLPQPNFIAASPVSSAGPRAGREENE